MVSVRWVPGGTLVVPGRNEYSGNQILQHGLDLVATICTWTCKLAEPDIGEFFLYLETQWVPIAAFCQERVLFVVRQFSQPPLRVMRMEFLGTLGRMMANSLSGPVFLTEGGITAEIFMESFAKAEFLAIWR